MCAETAGPGQRGGSRCGSWREDQCPGQEDFYRDAGHQARGSHRPGKGKTGRGDLRRTLPRNVLAVRPCVPTFNRRVTSPPRSVLSRREKSRTIGSWLFGFMIVLCAEKSIIG